MGIKLGHKYRWHATTKETHLRMCELFVVGTKSWIVLGIFSYINMSGCGIAINVTEFES